MNHDTTTRTPFWQVQAVFDPDGGGSDFAYTIGLGERGTHELHAWARPTHGLDVGADYKLSSQDLCHLLNEFAWEWLDGRLQVGDTRSVDLDDGLARMQISVGAPVPKRECDAFGAQGPLVVPLRWSLHRSAIGSDPGIVAGSECLWRERIATLRAASLRVAAIGGDRAPVTFETTQVYGPLTPWVLAVANALAGVPAAALASRLADGEVGRPSQAQVAVQSVARTVGRVGAVEAAHDLSQQVERIVTRRGSWRTSLGREARRLGLSRRELEPVVAYDLHLALFACLGAAVVEDVIEPWRISQVRQLWTPYVDFATG